MRKAMSGWILLLIFTSTALAQSSVETQPSESIDDTDPTKPVFITLREEYYNLRSERIRNVVIFRKDEVILNRSNILKPKGVILRFEIPAATTSTPDQTETGLGDIYIQGLFFPRLGKKFVVGAGSGLIFPTATDSLIGQGKWQAAPLVVPVYFFPEKKGFFLVKVHDFFSFAGNGTRPDIHYLLTTPTFLWRITRKNWILLDAESKTDWMNDRRTSLKAGIQLGRLFNPKFGFWIKPEFPFGKNRDGDWTLKFTFIIKK